MKLIGLEVIDEASRLHPTAKKPLSTWRALVEEAKWDNPHQLKAQFGKADTIGGKQVVFNIKGNDFRLLVKVDYQLQLVIIKKFGTHKEYDTWDLT